jgi:hypothetical protein
MTILLLSGIALAVIAALWMRQVVLWYLGISRIIELLSSIDESLRALPAVQKYDQDFGRKPPRAA